MFTQAGQKLGIKDFVYVDETRETLKQLINDPALRSLYPDEMKMLLEKVVKDPVLQYSLFAMWSQEDDVTGSNSDTAQSLGKFIMLYHRKTTTKKHIHIKP